ncbi:MAG: hypothetical protein H0X30_25915 [Anaerolineae bacterium]|nr:hypothetical protein [Anaerolineae bacterium]
METTNVRVTSKAHRLLKMLAILRDKDMSVVLEDFIAQNAPDVMAAYEAANKSNKTEEDSKQYQN